MIHFKKRLILLTWFLLILPLRADSQSIPSNHSSQHAKELWEMAITAKGGREKLNQVSNFVFTSANGTSGTFLVFPDKYFSWSDSRPSLFGLKVTIENYETGFGYMTSFDNPPQIKVYNDTGRRSPRRSHFLFDQIVYFLETKWLRPEVVRASKSTVRGKRVDLVEVLVDWYTETFKIGVYLDEKTHLPLRVGYFHDVGGNIYLGLDMQNYYDLGGIKVPSEVSSWDGNAWTKPRLEINAEYESEFFNRIPDLNAGPFQWRKAGAVVATQQLITQVKPLTAAQVAQYIQELISPDDDLSVAARRELITAGRQVVPILTEAIKSGSRTHRFRIAVVILEIDKQNPTALATLPSFLLDQQLGETERQDAAFGLLRNEQGITTLTDLLRHPDPFVRRCAVFAFDELTERAVIPSQVEKAMPALRELTHDKDEVTSKMAKEVLQQIGNRFKR